MTSGVFSHHCVLLAAHRAYTAGVRHCQRNHGSGANLTFLIKDTQHSQQSERRGGGDVRVYLEFAGARRGVRPAWWNHLAGAPHPTNDCAERASSALAYHYRHFRRYFPARQICRVHSHEQPSSRQIVPGSAQKSTTAWLDNVKQVLYAETLHQRRP